MNSFCRRSKSSWQPYGERSRKTLRIVSLLTIITILFLAPVRLTLSASGVDTGATFNNPLGNEADQYRIMHKVQDAIDDAPPGSVIRVAIYSLSIPRFADSLIAAKEKGVHVRVILDDHGVTDETHLYYDLQRVLGDNPRANSFAILCTGSCMVRNTPSYQHAKMYLFSQTGTTKNVSIISSANPTKSQATRGWNDAYTMTDKTMYASYVQYFDDMVRGKLGHLQPNYYRTTKSGIYKTYLYPKPITKPSQDTIQQIFDNISCTGAAKGYGKNGRTLVKIAMFEWSDARAYLAERVWKLDNAGCDVEVLYTANATGAKVIAALKKKGGKYGGPVIKNASIDTDNDGQLNYYLHNKYFLINGKYAGNPKSQIVFTGSHNFTKKAIRTSNEILLRITGNGPYSVYESHFKLLHDFAYGKLT